MQSILISIVLPIYCEEENIIQIYNKLENVTKSILNCRWEYIFINDGSTDDSYVELQKLATLDKKVKVLNLSRNFGKEVALSAGVEWASGNAVITMDADLQHPPELIPEMLKKWGNGVEIVSTIRRMTERESLMRRMGSIMFYWIMGKISHIEILPRTTDFRLLDRKVVDIFKTLTERGRMFRGLIDWMGFNKEFLEFNAGARQEGNSGYSYKKLFQLAIDSITSFSFFPLKVAGLLGIVITLLSGSLLIIMLPAYFIFKATLFSPLAIVSVTNTFLIGIVLSCLGLISLYIGRIHNEVTNRPLYIIKDRINFG